MILDHTPNLPNVRLTSEARPASAGWHDACWLRRHLHFSSCLFPFLGTFVFWTLKYCKHRDKAQVWFKRLLAAIYQYFRESIADEKYS